MDFQNYINTPSFFLISHVASQVYLWLCQGWCVFISMPSYATKTFIQYFQIHHSESFKLQNWFQEPIYQFQKRKTNAHIKEDLQIVLTCTDLNLITVYLSPDIWCAWGPRLLQIQLWRRLTILIIRRFQCFTLTP